MHRERVNFGATLMCDRRFAIVTGGFESKFAVGSACEIYNVEADSWMLGISMK